MAKNDGGPAFPSVLYSHERAENWSTDGMSLRDWFAGQALAGGIVRSLDNAKELGLPMAKTAAMDAYAFADAMLAERDK